MIVFVALAALMISSSFAANENLLPQNLCKLMVDGTRLRDITSCENYYTCLNGVATHYSCENGLQFNKDRQTCTAPAQSTCGTINGDLSQICNGAGKGTWVSDPYTCDGFYYCTGGNDGQKGNCEAGQYFNGNLQRCEYSGNTICEKGTSDDTSKDAVCNIVPNGVYFASATSCFYWAVCEGGQYSSRICGEDTKFNTRNGDCDYVSRCTQTSIGGPTDPGTSYPEPPVSDGACTVKNDYKTDGTCVGFYWCSEQSIWRRGVCANYKAFDPVSKKCVARSQVSCPNDPCRNTKGSNLLWVNDANNCRNYIHCQNNQATASGECLNGFFNVDLQRCVKKLDLPYKACDAGGIPPTTDDPEGVTPENGSGEDGDGPEPPSPDDD